MIYTSTLLYHLYPTTSSHTSTWNVACTTRVTAAGPQEQCSRKEQRISGSVVRIIGFSQPIMALFVNRCLCPPPRCAPPRRTHFLLIVCCVVCCAVLPHIYVDRPLHPALFSSPEVVQYQFASTLWLRHCRSLHWTKSLRTISMVTCTLWSTALCTI
jgi:hypothetical protein